MGHTRNKMTVRGIDLNANIPFAPEGRFYDLDDDLIVAFEAENRTAAFTDTSEKSTRLNRMCVGNVIRHQSEYDSFIDMFDDGLDIGQWVDVYCFDLKLRSARPYSALTGTWVSRWNVRKTILEWAAKSRIYGARGFRLHGLTQGRMDPSRYGATFTYSGFLGSAVFRKNDQVCLGHLTKSHLREQEVENLLKALQKNDPNMNIYEVELKLAGQKIVRKV